MLTGSVIEALAAQSQWLYVRATNEAGVMGGEMFSRSHGFRSDFGPNRLWMQHLRANSAQRVLSRAKRSTIGGAGVSGALSLVKAEQGARFELPLDRESSTLRGQVCGQTRQIV